MECQIKPNGNLGIYGRYFDYSESDFQMTSLEAERYDDFKIYGNGIDYYIYTSRIRSEEGGTVQSSAFLAELDLAGGETDMRVYSALNDFRVPSISQTGSLNKLNSAGEFLLTIAQAEAEDRNLRISCGKRYGDLPDEIFCLRGGFFVGDARPPEGAERLIRTGQAA